MSRVLPLNLLPPGSVVRSASMDPTQTQHGNEMLAKLETQYLAIQFADFLQAGSRILTSLLFSLT